MIEAAKDLWVVLVLGFVVWGYGIYLAKGAALPWLFWALIAVFVIVVVGVLWAMFFWPWPRTTRTAQGTK